MKRLLLLIAILAGITATGYADTQKARVRTARLPGKKYELVPDVEISIKGINSDFKSNKNGLVEFELRPLRLKTGDEFNIDRIYKRGFSLLDQRTYQYSPNSTTDIVLVDLKKQADETQKATAKMLDNAQKNYDKDIARLKRELDNKTISLEEHRKQVRELQDNLDKYQQQIPEYAKRLTSFDYETIDKDNETINLALLNGDFATADSILRKLNAVAMADSLIRQREAIDVQQKTLDALKAENSANTEKVAEMLYSQYLVAASKFQNDSAAYYLQKRIELMPDNPIYLFEAGRFVANYLAKYSEALDYYNRALVCAIEKHGGNHPDVTAYYNNIGCVYYYQVNYAEALRFYEKALKIDLENFGENHPNVATSYSNIGVVYNDQGNYSEALIFSEKALKILLELFGENHPAVATSYNNIGLIYDEQGNYTQALKYLEKALNIQLEIFGENHPNVATFYNNIGAVYAEQGNYAEALKYFEKALKILLAIFDENHPNVATSYHNIGSVYDNQGNYPEALKYYEKALKIDLEIFGEKHPHVAQYYNNIGKLYDKQGNYTEALKYYNKVLELDLEIFGENHPYINIDRDHIAQMEAKIAEQQSEN